MKMENGRYSNKKDYTAQGKILHVQMNQMKLTKINLKLDRYLYFFVDYKS